MATAIDFELSDEQRAFRDGVLEFSRRELSTEPEATGSRETLGASAPSSGSRACVPVEYGGLDATPMTIVLALEALGYGCRDNGLIFSLNAQMWACEAPLVRFGSEAQKRRYLPRLCDRSLIAAHGMTEPDAGSDAFSLKTTASRRGDRYDLTGRRRS